MEETKLSSAELAEYKALLAKPFFKKSDLPQAERFYEDGGGYDKLSAAGKDQIGIRLELGLQPQEARESYFARRKGGTVLVTHFNKHQDLVVADMEQGGERKVGSTELIDRLTDLLQLEAKQPDYTKVDWQGHDALEYAYLIRSGLRERIAYAQKQSPGEGAEFVENVFTVMVENLAIMAHSELEVAMFEQIASRRLDEQ